LKSEQLNPIHDSQSEQHSSTQQMSNCVYGPPVQLIILKIWPKMSATH